MMARRRPTEALVTELEARNWRLAGRTAAQIPELANWRVIIRRRFYRLADFFFAASIFHWLVAHWAIWPWQGWAHIGGFALSFVMLFFCEFRARLITRQLHRRAAEQLARDIMGLKG